MEIGAGQTLVSIIVNSTCSRAFATAQNDSLLTRFSDSGAISSVFPKNVAREVCCADRMVNQDYEQKEGFSKPSASYATQRTPAILDRGAVSSDRLHSNRFGDRTTVFIPKLLKERFPGSWSVGDSNPSGYLLQRIGRMST